jgi:NAD-dependent deacetylase
MLPQDALSESYRVLDTCNFLLLIGTSLVIYPAAGLPMYAKEKGAKIVEINSEPSGSPCDLLIRGKAGQVVPEILELL